MKYNKMIAQGLVLCGLLGYSGNIAASIPPEYQKSITVEQKSSSLEDEFGPQIEVIVREDFDGDGKSDLVIRARQEYSDKKEYLYFGLSAGDKFTPPVLLLEVPMDDNTGKIIVTPVDMNMDGSLDLRVGVQYPDRHLDGRTYTLFNDGKGKFTYGLLKFGKTDLQR